MFACICAATTESEVRDCVHHGARSVDDIGDACGAGTGCGSCRERLGVLLRRAAAPSELDGLAASA